MLPYISVNKAAYSGFETQRRRHQKSKTEVSVAPQKGLMFSKFSDRNKGEKADLLSLRSFYWTKVESES